MDTLSSLIFHNLFGRFPNINVLSVENGSIWVDGDTLPHRVLLFIAQYLAIVVPRSQIVSNMHQAYERSTAPGPR